MTIPRAGQPGEILAWHSTPRAYVLDTRAHWSLFHKVSFVLALRLLKKKKSYSNLGQVLFFLFGRIHQLVRWNWPDSKAIEYNC